MRNPTRHRTGFATAALALIGAIAMLPSLKAQDRSQTQRPAETGMQAPDAPAQEIVVGTYDPQAVAEQAGVPQRIEAAMQPFQQRLVAAQQEGDQQAMQQIQVEAQQVQQTMAAEFFAEVGDAMPPVARRAGVDVIAAEVAYAAPGVTTKDLTTEVVRAVSE
jgi:hypothetical protein